MYDDYPRQTKWKLEIYRTSVEYFIEFEIQRAMGKWINKKQYHKTEIYLYYRIPEMSGLEKKHI